MSGNSPDSPDPRREFEEQWGRRGTRGIRGGASAKRKRDAWIRFQSEQTGVPPDQIPVVHAGGLSRPLYTPTSWEPVNQLSDSDVEIVAEQVVIHETDLEGVFSLSAPVSREAGSLRPKLLASKPKSRSSSAVAPSTAPAPVAASSSSSRPVPSRAPESGAASSSSSRPIPSRAPVPEPVNPPSSASSSGPSPAVRRLAKLHPRLSCIFQTANSGTERSPNIQSGWLANESLPSTGIKSATRSGSTADLAIGLGIVTSFHGVYLRLINRLTAGSVRVTCESYCRTSTTVDITKNSFSGLSFKTNRQSTWWLSPRRGAESLASSTPSERYLRIAPPAVWLTIIRKWLTSSIVSINTTRRVILSSSISVFLANRQWRKQDLIRLGTLSSICRRFVNSWNGGVEGYD